MSSSLLSVLFFSASAAQVITSTPVTDDEYVVTIGGSGLLATFGSLPTNNLVRAETRDGAVSLDFEEVTDRRRVLASVRIVRLSDQSAGYLKNLQSVRERIFQDDVSRDCSIPLSLKRSVEEANPASDNAKPMRIEAMCSRPRFGKWSSSFGVMESLNSNGVRCEWTFREEVPHARKFRRIQMQDVCAVLPGRSTGTATINIVQLTDE